jgi:hypothetical protein
MNRRSSVSPEDMAAAARGVAEPAGASLVSSAGPRPDRPAQSG